MVARSRNGETKAFPVVETIHKDNICHTTEAPARVPHDTLLKAQRVAQQAVECLEGVRAAAAHSTVRCCVLLVTSNRIELFFWELECAILIDIPCWQSLRQWQDAIRLCQCDCISLCSNSV